MKRILALPFILLLLQCSPDKTTTTESKDSLNVSDSIGGEEISAEGYEKHLASLPMVKESSLEGLKLFSNVYKNNQPEENDKALKIYLDFQSKLIDVLNSQSDQDVEKLNALVFGDSSQRTPELIALEKEIQQKGLNISQSEGTIFLDKNPDVIGEYFLASLSPAGKAFFTQFAEETKSPYSEDAGLRISIKDLADRVVYWDKYLVSYPDHLFSEEAKSRYGVYRSALLFGLDNTPAFEPETKKISNEFSDAYQYIVEKYPNTQTAKMIGEYIKLLKANGGMYDSSVDKFYQSLK